MFQRCQQNANFILRYNFNQNYANYFTIPSKLLIIVFSYLKSNISLSKYPSFEPTMEYQS